MSRFEGHFVIPRTAINEVLTEMEQKAREYPESPEAIGYEKAVLKIRTEFGIPKTEATETRR